MTQNTGSSSNWLIQVDDLSSEPTLALLSLHLEGMHASSPNTNVFALDVSGLKDPAITVWTAWDGDNIAGIVALKSISVEHGEIKSMRTHPDYLRRGVAASLLEHLIQESRQKGFRQLSLETGSGAAFDAAISLYRKYGFQEGGPFSDYPPGAFNQFFHLYL